MDSKASAAPATVIKKTLETAIEALLREGQVKLLLSPETGLEKVAKATQPIAVGNAGSLVLWLVRHYQVNHFHSVLPSLNDL